MLVPNITERYKGVRHLTLTIFNKPSISSTLLRFQRKFFKGFLNILLNSSQDHKRNKPSTEIYILKSENKSSHF